MSLRPCVCKFTYFFYTLQKSYQRSSFNTLVAIMTGLQSDWVKRAMRKSMHRLAVWDNRLLTDFKVFTSSEDNFKHIRGAIDAINDAKPLETTSRTASVVNSGSTAADMATAPTACVPFIGKPSTSPSVKTFLPLSSCRCLSFATVPVQSVSGSDRPYGSQRSRYI